MKKFEVGKKYRDGAMVFEILERTEKTAKVAYIQHAGRSNEKVTSIKRKKINKWEHTEMIFCDPYEIMA